MSFLGRDEGQYIYPDQFRSSQRKPTPPVHGRRRQNGDATEDRNPVYDNPANETLLVKPSAKRKV